MPSLVPDELPPGAPPTFEPQRQDEAEPQVVEQPSLPSSRPRRPTPTEGSQPPPPPPQSPPPAPRPSSTSSTSEGPPEPPKPRPKAPPEDILHALEDGSDVALEALMGGAEALHRRLAHRDLAADAWHPSEDERARLRRPTARIIARHVPNAELADADAIDAALIGATLLSIGLRSARSPAPKPEEAPSGN